MFRQRQNAWVLLVFLIAPCVGHTAPAFAKELRNVLFILVDDLGWTDLGCYGSTFYDTPHLDAFADSGMRFDAGYAACPVCSPTRAAIMTGNYPARVGITDWIPGMNYRSLYENREPRVLAPEDQHNLPYEEQTIAETLKANGYTTFFAGKWHLGEEESYWPEHHGFDVNQGGWSVGSPRGGYYAPWINPRLENGPDGEYLPDRLTDETIRFLEQAQGQPFLAFLSFYTVHTPIQACQRHLPEYQAKLEKLPPLADSDRSPLPKPCSLARQDNAAYATMVHSMDENVGRVLSKLDELGMSDETLVIFTSDNGGLAGVTSVLPLRGGKGWCYEGGIRVPLIIRAPGVTKPGSNTHTPASSIDFYPTILELLDLPNDSPPTVDGVSLKPVLLGKTLSRDTLYWHYPHFHGSGWKPGAALRCGHWKLIEFYDDDKVELFDLASDLSETHDVSQAHPEKTRELLDKLRGWQKSVGAKMPMANPNYRGG